MTRWIAILAVTVALAGCAGGYTEKQSPCACAWTPIDGNGELAIG